MASRDADGGRAQKSKREGAYFFLVAFFFVAFFTVFFGAVFTAFFFAAFAAIVTLASLSPFEMLADAPSTTEAHHDDAHRSFYYDESRNGPNRRGYTPAPTLDAGPRVTPSHRVSFDSASWPMPNLHPKPRPAHHRTPQHESPQQQTPQDARHIHSATRRKTNAASALAREGWPGTQQHGRKPPRAQPRPA